MCFDHFNEVSKLHDQGGLAGKVSGHQHCARPIILQSDSASFFLGYFCFPPSSKSTPSLLHWRVLLCSWSHMDLMAAA